MKYTSGAAFRQAIDARLKRVVADHDEATMVYARRQIVFDRFLARLLFKYPDRWALKGGVALTYRLNLSSRFTRDLDLLLRASPELVDEALQGAIATDLNDFFSFTVQRRQELIHLEDASSIRYHVLAALDGRRFDTFVIDIGFDLPGSLPPDGVPGSELLAFAELERLLIPTVPIEIHLAEKLHAYVRGYGDDQPSTRVKDLVDMVLIGREQELLAGRTLRALGHTFSIRGGVLPGSLAAPPGVLAGNFSGHGDCGWDRSGPWRGLCLRSKPLRPAPGGKSHAGRRMEPSRATLEMMVDSCHDLGKYYFPKS